MPNISTPFIWVQYSEICKLIDFLKTSSFFTKEQDLWCEYGICISSTVIFNFETYEEMQLWILRRISSSNNRKENKQMWEVRVSPQWWAVQIIDTSNCKAYFRKKHQKLETESPRKETAGTMKEKRLQFLQHNQWTSWESVALSQSHLCTPSTAALIMNPLYVKISLSFNSFNSLYPFTTQNSLQCCFKC